MKQLLFLLMVSFSYVRMGAQISFVTLPMNDGNYEFIINISTSITPAQLNSVNFIKTQFNLVVTDQIQTLGFEKWRVPNALVNSIKTALYGIGFVLEQQQPSYRRLPRSTGDATRPIRTSRGIRIDTIGSWAEMSRAAQWTENAFFQNCAPRNLYPIRLGVIGGGISLNAQGLPYGDLTYYDAVGSRDFTSEIADNRLKLNDLVGLGTQTYGVIEKAYRKAGMNPNSKITVLKAFKRDSTANLWSVLKAIDHSISLGLNIILCPYDLSPAPTTIVNGVRVKPILERAIEQAQSFNLLFVSNAGDQNLNVDAFNNLSYFPANFQNNNLIITTAYDYSTATRSDYANIGVNSVHIAAPGTVITRHIGSDAMTYIACGTSFSASITASAAAILAATQPNFNWQTTKNILLGRLNHSHQNWIGKLIPSGGVLSSLCPPVGGLRKLEGDSDSNKGDLQVSQAGQTLQITYAGNQNSSMMVRIVDMMGKTVFEQNRFVNNNEPTVWNWLSESAQNGVYIIQLQADQQTILTQKWVKVE